MKILKVVKVAFPVVTGVAAALLTCHLLEKSIHKDRSISSLQYMFLLFGVGGLSLVAGDMAMVTTVYMIGMYEQFLKGIISSPK